MPDAIPNVLENYVAAAQANPTSVEAQSNLGWGYYGQHQYPDAIKTFQAALALDNGYIDAHYGLALALKENQQGAQAVPEFETVIKLTSQLENSERGMMLAKLARGHINQIQSGDWNLDTDMRQSPA
jgi:tetratricopeptide (TPR) repeat protein